MIMKQTLTVLVGLAACGMITVATANTSLDVTANQCPAGSALTYNSQTQTYSAPGGWTSAPVTTGNLGALGFVGASTSQVLNNEVFCNYFPASGPMVELTNSAIPSATPVGQNWEAYNGGSDCGFMSGGPAVSSPSQCQFTINA